MERVKIYPNYWNYYYYDEGDTKIFLVRKVGGKIVYKDTFFFDTPKEAVKYFESECGA